jgi:hypothetical protein
MKYRTRYGSLATYAAQADAAQQLRAAARRDIAAQRYALDDLPNGCDLWYDLQTEQELKF